MKKKHIIMLSMGIPLAAMLVYMILFEVEPFGTNSFLIIDGLHQYMPFFSVLYDKLKGGDSLFYSFRAGLGINFLSLFSYYLSSPLNLFLLLFKKTQLNMAVSLLIVLKVSLSGLASGIYFSSKKKEPDLTVLVCAVGYALNSYMVGYCWNVMWLDAIMVFPIILLGLERLIEKGDGRLYCLALFYALYCNYYIAFMICIFVVLWYLLFSFRNVRQFFFRGFLFAGYSLLAAGMAAVMLIPAYMGIRQTASGESFSLPEHNWQTGLADLLTRQIDLAQPVSHDNFDGNANLYMGIFVIVAVVLYLLNKEIRWTDKVKKGLLMVLFYVSYSEDILNFIWHGFHNQFGIPNRFSFLGGFLLLYMFYEVMQHREGIRNWHVILGCFFGAGILYASYNLSENGLEDGVYAAAGLLLFLYGFLLFVMTINKRFEKYHVMLLVFAAVTELCVTAGIGFNYIGQISVPKFFYGTEDMERATESLSDGTFYRSELAATKIVDENAWYNLNGVGLFGSTALDHMVKMMDSLGFYTGCNEYLYKGATPVTNMLLGVRYLYYHPEDALTTNFEYRDTFGDFAVHENPVEKLSVGYMINNDIQDWYYESAYPFRVQNELCSLGYDVYDIFENVEIFDPETEGCTASRTNDGEYYFEFESQLQDNMVFTIPVEKDMDNLYVFYDGTQVENAEIYVNDDMVLSGDLDSQVLTVGRVDMGSRLMVKFKLKGETESGYVRLSAADFQSREFGRLEKRMGAQALEIEKMSSRALSGKVSAGVDQTLLFSIPYDEGWKATVDGKPARTTKIGEAFLALPLAEGTHEITLKYTPEGFVPGCILSLLSLSFFILLCAFYPKMQKLQEEKRRKKEEEALLAQEREILGMDSESKSSENG